MELSTMGMRREPPVGQVLTPPATVNLELSLEEMEREPAVVETWLSKFD